MVEKFLGIYPGRILEKVMFIERVVIKASALNLRSLQIYVSVTLLSECKRTREMNIIFFLKFCRGKYPKIFLPFTAGIILVSDYRLPPIIR